MQNRPKPVYKLLYLSADEDTYHLVKSCLQNEAFTFNSDHISAADQIVAALQREKYDLFIIELSEEDAGTVILTEIKKSPTDVPCILLAPSFNEALVEQAYQCGVRDFMVKSELQFQDLQDRIKKYCERTELDLNIFQPDTARKVRCFEISTDSSLSREPGLRDALTGVYNHSHLFERMVDEFARAKRHGYPIACIVFDIDHFKEVNEKWNYRAGDELLKEATRLLIQNCRLSDFIARYGGEEFAILMPHADYEGASELAERLRSIFSKHTFKMNDEEIQVTISLGIAAFPEDDMPKRADLLSLSVQALYKSKASGRNRVTRYRDIVPVFGKNDLPELRISEEKIAEFQRKITEITSHARRVYIDAAKAMIMALENKDHFTAGHAGSVARYAGQIAEGLGLPQDEAEVVEHAALLHDIGKVCIPDPILLKPQKLTFAEFETMRQHPYLGYKMLKPLKFLDREAKLVLHHHEWFNGEGYPCRLKGEEIPLGSRIISVADAYDTMRSAGGRYKKTCSVEAAVEELITCSLVQFDPRIVKAFIDVLVLRSELSPTAYDKAQLEKLIHSCGREQPRDIPIDKAE